MPFLSVLYPVRFDQSLPNGFPHEMEYLPGSQKQTKEHVLLCLLNFLSCALVSILYPLLFFCIAVRHPPIHPPSIAVLTHPFATCIVLRSSHATQICGPDGSEAQLAGCGCSGQKGVLCRARSEAWICWVNVQFVSRSSNDCRGGWKLITVFVQDLQGQMSQDAEKLGKRGVDMGSFTNCFGF